VNGVDSRFLRLSKGLMGGRRFFAFADSSAVLRPGTIHSLWDLRVDSS